MGHSNCDKCGHDKKMCACSSVNSIQIGGEHYKREYQHWDWCIDIRLGYLESAATKYLSRWREKGGVQDIDKSMHYMTKAQESFVQGRYQNDSLFNTGFESDRLKAKEKTEKFLSGLDCTPVEVVIILSCACWRHPEEITGIVKRIQEARELALAGTHTKAPFKGPHEAAGAAPRHAGDIWPGSRGQQHPFGYDGEG